MRFSVGNDHESGCKNYYSTSFSQAFHPSLLSPLGLHTLKCTGTSLYIHLFLYISIYNIFLGHSSCRCCYAVTQYFLLRGDFQLSLTEKSENNYSKATKIPAWDKLLPASQTTNILLHLFKNLSGKSMFHRLHNKFDFLYSTLCVLSFTSIRNSCSEWELA